VLTSNKLTILLYADTCTSGRANDN